MVNPKPSYFNKQFTMLYKAAGDKIGNELIRSIYQLEQTRLSLFSQCQKGYISEQVFISTRTSIEEAILRLTHQYIQQQQNGVPISSNVYHHPARFIHEVQNKYCREIQFNINGVEDTFFIENGENGNFAIPLPDFLNTLFQLYYAFMGDSESLVYVSKTDDDVIYIFAPLFEKIYEQFKQCIMMEKCDHVRVLHLTTEGDEFKLTVRNKPGFPASLFDPVSCKDTSEVYKRFNLMVNIEDTFNRREGVFFKFLSYRPGLVITFINSQLYMDCDIGKFYKEVDDEMHKFAS